MAKPKSRAIYAINGVEISEEEFKKQVGADNFSIMFEDALAAYKDVGGQSVYTMGSLPDRFIIDFEEDGAQ